MGICRGRRSRRPTRPWRKDLLPDDDPGKGEPRGFAGPPAFLTPPAGSRIFPGEAQVHLALLPRPVLRRGLSCFRGPEVTYFACLDEFGHIGPYVSRTHPRYRESPVFGLAGFTAGPYGRIFAPTPHGSPSWHGGYRCRAALERIYRRIDHDFGFERHFVRGQAGMQTRIGLSIAVMMAAALGHVRAGQPRRMRSRVQPFADTG